MANLMKVKSTKSILKMFKIAQNQICATMPLRCLKMVDPKLFKFHVFPLLEMSNLFELKK